MYMIKINTRNLAYINSIKLLRIISEDCLRGMEERCSHAENLKGLKTRLNLISQCSVMRELPQNSEQYTQKLIKLDNRITSIFAACVDNLSKQIYNIIPVRRFSLNDSEIKIGEKGSENEIKKKPKEKKNKVPEVLDVSKLDFRIGRIISVKKHPDADSLYVEDIDIGEAQPRVVVSGLVNHVTLEEMNNRLVVLLCNVKPVKMRGVTSEAMVMCASSAEKVEILIPPENSIPGDRIVFEGYPQNPNPLEHLIKKKIFEQIQPDLRTSADKVATYKNVPFTVPGKGIVVASTMKLSAIK